MTDSMHSSITNMAELLAAMPAFSFTYDNRPSATCLEEWKCERSPEKTVWTDQATGLRVTCEVKRFADYPAVEWVLWFENVGDTDTAIVSDLQVLELLMHAPLASNEYHLHHTSGAPSNATDFTTTVFHLSHWRRVDMAGGGGRSSNAHLPFFKVDTAIGSLICAVGWSGQWRAQVGCLHDYDLFINAGLESAHFRLHPGERVRTPRILLYAAEGDTWDANAGFRQLIYQHYAARRGDDAPLPFPFCNTCFTRGGGWLNECNAENQISLIRAYAALGAEAVITDAGWFVGGWPDGAGNWDVRPDAYPDGMAPVAAAALESGILYGLWFEPERVVCGTRIDREHPDWVLRSARSPRSGSQLLNFGLPAVRDYWIDLLAKFMELPGFHFYRQDFNIDPLVFWRDNEAPDRQGIVEMHYIAGLYEFWDRLTAAWPQSIRETCASGGRRIDLETVARMHTHQDSDYWFDDEIDQSQIWALSQYMPNSLFTTPLIRLDDYSFHSTLATSLCLGWIADAVDFPADRARELLTRYHAIRHLLIGAWYPLLPDTRNNAAWMASQYHRRDLDEGLLIVFRRQDSPHEQTTFRLHELDTAGTYTLAYDGTNVVEQRTGAELLAGFTVALPPRGSAMIHYQRA